MSRVLAVLVAGGALCIADALTLNGHGHSHKSHQQEDDGELKGGDMVEITGSTASAGKRGMLEDFDEEKGKWLVRFSEGKGIYFREALLKAAPKHAKTEKQEAPKHAKTTMAHGDADDDDEADWPVKFRPDPSAKEEKVLSRKEKKGLEHKEAKEQHKLKKATKSASKQHVAEDEDPMLRKIKASEGVELEQTKKNKIMASLKVAKKEETAKKDQPKKKPGPNAAAEGGLGYYLAPLYKQAQREEGLPEKVPGWPVLFKYPRSWIEKIDAIPAQRHPATFNFVGSFYKNAATKAARGWVIDFAKRRFSDSDYFRITGPLDNHQSLGDFDHTFEKSKASYPYASFNDPNFVAPFDEKYFAAMKNSKFTLCPAGDGPWSIRFFEAMLVGSIPIVEKEKHIIGMEGPKMSKALKWKYYLLNDDPNYQYEYRPDWVKENKEKFMKYFTFIHGNNKFTARDLASASPNNLF